MKNQKNKSLPLNSYLKSNVSKKDKEIKKYRRRARGLLIMLIIVGAIAFIQIAQNMFQNTKSDTNGIIVTSYLNETILNNTNGTRIVSSCQEPTLTTTIVKGITTFMNKLFEYPDGFWIKFFIFLGIIYLIQVCFSLVFDVVELILLVFVAIKRLIVWIYRKITGRNKHEETEQKIAGL
jgi:uncharacterized membrane protein